MTIIETQNTETNADCDDTMTPLYEAIRFRISESFFCRRRIDEDELLHQIFMKLVARYLPPPESEEMTELLDNAIADTIREMKRDRKKMRDITEISADDGPACVDWFDNEEREFETVFERFCNSYEEPERSVYRRCRTHRREDLAKLHALTHQEICRMLEKMPARFKYFVKNDRD